MSKEKRVVITGLGVLSCIGKGKDEFWQSLQEGRCGFKPVTLFDPSQFRVNMAGEVPNFDPKVYMGPKGLRTLDRSTMVLVSAAKLAIDDCGFKITDENTDDVGVAIGTTLGSLKSIAEFDEITLREGPRYTNPALFPNTVINSPASQISIWHHIEGFNTTISTGFTASLDAMSYAYDFIQMGRSKVILTGSVEEMCIYTYYGFYALNYLSGAKEGSTYVNCPFDRRRNGITFSEGACVVVMEELEHALERKAHIMAEVLGFGYYFDPFRLHKFNPRGTGFKEAMRAALKDAELEPKDIDYICANANSTPSADKIETQAIKEVFGEYSKNIPVSAVKSMLGESFSAGGAFATAASLGALERNFIPPTINYQEKDPDCDLDYVPNKARSAKPKHILVNTFGVSGNNCCMILRRYDE
ncbi:MAG: beta-ketoacyl-[acyl-carrier-protein] synthase family protein [Candidatus Omnitrophota bacterium]|nr:beta-ketoacyl-[acyl-carrier-protein] synthase family protein [Candidatus Omnitrophota bacterium]